MTLYWMIAFQAEAAEATLATRDKAFRLELLELKLED